MQKHLKAISSILVFRLIICLLILIVTTSHLNNIMYLHEYVEGFGLKDVFKYFVERKLYYRYIALGIVLFATFHQSKFTWYLLASILYFLTLFSVLMILAYLPDGISKKNYVFIFACVISLLLLNQDSFIVASSFNHKLKLRFNLLAVFFGLLLLLIYIPVYNRYMF